MWGKRHIFKLAIICDPFLSFRITFLHCASLTQPEAANVALGRTYVELFVQCPWILHKGRSKSEYNKKS